MSLINTEVKPFAATAYHNGQFVEVSEANFKGKWSVVFFYPADFTFVCPTELGDRTGEGVSTGVNRRTEIPHGRSR